MVQSVCEDATGGGDQIGKLLWDLVGAGSLLLPLVPVWEARRSQRQGLFDRVEAAWEVTNNMLRKCGHPGPPGMSLQQLEPARHRWQGTQAATCPGTSHPLLSALMGL